MNSNNQTAPITDKVNIRTMQDDLAGRPPASTEISFASPKPPDKLPISSEAKTPPSPRPMASPAPGPAPLPAKEPPAPEKPPVQAAPMPAIPSAPKPSPAPLPTPPLPPKRSSEIYQMTGQEEPKRKLTLRFWLYLALGISCLALVTTLGFLFYKQKPSPEPPIVEPQPDQLIPTPTLIPQVEITFVRLADKSKIELKNKISEIAEKTTQGTKTLRLVVTISKDQVEKTLALSEISEILELKIPASIKSSAEETYNLILVSSPVEDLSKTSEREDRLVLVFETNQPSQAKEALKSWETTMVKDLEGLMLESPGQEASPEFQETEYKGAKIRYKNLPYSSLTVDYAVLEGLIIITTSKQSIYTIYELVLNQPLGP